MKQPALFLSLLSLIAITFLTSCISEKKKDPCDGVICDYASKDPSGGPIFPLTLRFNIREKATGSDYFFSAPPAYTFSQLVVQSPDSANATKTYIDSVSHHNFRISALKSGNNTLYFKIANLKTDTLQFSQENYNLTCCALDAVLTNIRLNGKPYLQKFDLIKDTVLFINKE